MKRSELIPRHHYLVHWSNDWREYESAERYVIIDTTDNLRTTRQTRWGHKTETLAPRHYEVEGQDVEAEVTTNTHGVPHAHVLAVRVNADGTVSGKAELIATRTIRAPWGEGREAQQARSAEKNAQSAERLAQRKATAKADRELYDLLRAELGDSTKTDPPHSWYDLTVSRADVRALLDKLAALRERASDAEWRLNPEPGH